MEEIESLHTVYTAPMVYYSYSTTMQVLFFIRQLKMYNCANAPETLVVCPQFPEILTGEKALKTAIHI